MDKGKKSTSKKVKPPEVIIFTPQELVDLGILQNIHQVQKSSDIKSKANKKRIIEVIEKSLNANKEQPSTSKSSQSLPVVDSQVLKKTITGKLSGGAHALEASKAPVKVINSEIAIPKIPLSRKRGTKSPDSGILLPSLVNKKLKKKALNVTPANNNRSILNKDIRIKEMIMSAVRSNSKEGSPPSNTPIDTNIPESDSSHILTKSSRIPNIEEPNSNDFNMHDSKKSDAKQLGRSIEFTSTQEQSQNKSDKKEIRVFSNTQLSLTKEQLKTLIMPQMNRTNHQKKIGESYNLSKVEFLETTSLNNKGKKISKNSEKIVGEKNLENHFENQDEYMDKSDIDGTDFENNSVSNQDIEFTINTQSKSGKLKFYSRIRKDDEIKAITKEEMYLINVAKLGKSGKGIKSDFHDNAKYKLDVTTDRSILPSSCSITEEITGPHKSFNKNFYVDTCELNVEETDIHSESSSQISNREISKEQIDLDVSQNISNELSASYSTVTLNSNKLLQKDMTERLSNDETQEKPIEISDNAKQFSESQKPEGILKEQSVFNQPSQSQKSPMTLSNLKKHDTIKSCLRKNSEKESDIEEKHLFKEGSEKAPDFTTLTSSSEAVNSKTEETPILSQVITNKKEFVGERHDVGDTSRGQSNTLFLDSELSERDKVITNPKDIDPPSTQISKSSGETRDANCSFENNEVKTTTSNRSRCLGAEKALNDITELEMLMNVGKRTKNVVKGKSLKPILNQSEPPENEQILPVVVETENLLVAETTIKKPKRRGRPPKNKSISSKAGTNVNIIYTVTSTPEVQKQTGNRVSLSEMDTSPKSCNSKELDKSVNNETTEILEQFSEAFQPDISKQTSSEIAQEVESEEIINKTLKNNLESVKEKNLQKREITEEVMQQLTDGLTIVPKKRGRPRKNPLDPPKPKKTKVVNLNGSSDDIEMDIVEMEISKSGRKRRKINYFDMENSFTDDVNDTKIKNYSSDTDEEKKHFKPKKIKVSFESLNQEQFEVVTIENKDKSEGSNEELNDNDEALKPEPTTAMEVMEMQPSISGEASGKVEDSSSANNNSVASLNALPKVHTEVKMGSNANDTVEQEVKPNKLKTKKYNKTGETQRMMQSIFSAAVKAVTSQSDNKEDQACQQVSTETQALPKPPTVGYRGRRKKSQACTTIVIDGDGKVKCCTCNTKVVNKEWQSHNRNVHYNLAWREGEHFVNVDDHVFVRRSLTPLLHEDKSLVCLKCNKEFFVVNEFIQHREECLEIVKNSMVTCAICKEEIEQIKWMSHKKKKHNNLTWRVGDPPLDLSNQALVMQVLNALYKAKTPLYCYKCRESKKSVIGFLSHQSQCGFNSEDAKIECPLCGKRVLPVSMPSHNKLVHEPKPDQEDLTLDSLEVGTGSNKRNAAIKAMKLIDMVSQAKLATIFAKEYVESPNLKEEEFVLKLLQAELNENDILKCKFGTCEMACKQWEQMVEHLDECPQKPEQYFVCKRCFEIVLLEEEIKNHVRGIHNVKLRDDADYVAIEGSDGEDEEKFRQELLKIRRQQSQQIARNDNVKIKPRFLHSLPKTKNRLCTSAFEYTLEFYNEHYTESVLFDRLRYLKSDWSLLNDESFDDYLPKAEYSCQVTTKLVPSFNNMLKQDHTFTSLELFDVIEHEEGATLFCGGPVTAMAWLPTPHMLLYCKQVLAVAVSKEFDSKYLINMKYSEPCMIQFWDFGVLKKKIQPQKPRFFFGLAINFGPIWHMEWCPSGCYDEKVLSNDRMQRMGLLAVAGSVPTVNIYSIPFIKDEDNTSLIYQAKPLVRLKLFRGNDNSKTKCFPTRISWGKASGHSYIAVGYTDGMVALFNLNTTSELLKFTDELDVDTIFPYKTLKAHTYYISVLSLIHLGGGKRYLLTGSFDRNVMVWDLTNDTSSVLARRKVLSDGTWLTNWLAFATSVDESNTNNAPATTCIASHRNYMYDVAHMIGSPSSITSLSSSDWLNGLLQGTSCGEILVTFPGQLLYSLDSDKRTKSLRWMLGYAKLIDMSLSPAERLKEYEEEKELAKSRPKRTECDRDTAAYIFNQGDKLKKYQPHTYEKATEKYGLVFCDIKRKSFEETAKYNLLDVLESSRPDLYPLQAINKVAFNPNSQSSLYFAVGYQAGFVRFRYMKFLENDKQVV